MGSVASQMSQQMAENQKKNMEAQQRQMIAMQMATSREMCYWIGGVWAGVLTAGIVTRRRIVIVPLTALSIVLAYNIDFAYGNKVDRIRAEHYKVLKEKHWFTDKKFDSELKEKVENMEVVKT